MLRFGADTAISDIHSRTTLHHAASINAADIIRILLETEEIEACFNLWKFFVPNFNSLFCLQFENILNSKLIPKNCCQNLRLIVLNEDIFAVQGSSLDFMLIKVDAIDDADCSPLMTVAKLGYRDPEAIALLIDAGADINCTGNHVNGEMYKGRTALHYAIMQSNQELARYLVERGANLNIQDHMVIRLNLSPCSSFFSQGQTPLFLAASQGHVEMVHMLVTAGARRYIPDNMDQTPEEIANYKEYREVVQYFRNLRMQNDSVTNGNGRSKSRNVKKPRLVTISPTPLEMILNTTAMTPESSNSSNSSSFFDHFKEYYNLSSHVPCEVNAQVPSLPNTIPQQNSQHFVQIPYSSMNHMANQNYNMRNSCLTINENRPVSSTSLLEFEHYV
ncbi:unnamed protein product [Brugia timori]|uniref:ANK_REP_REGION domain-containing protein n=1 Tax=Brugia timori TaxID=42155 RepID=A0A3P7ZAF1_9BILA|nr:unnamed protein product [Brugia timori]